MSAPNQDFEVDEGSSRDVIVPLTVNGGPYNVVDGIVHWWASPSQFDNAASVPIKFFTGSGVAVNTVGGQSTVSIFIQPGTTTGLGQRKLFHQCIHVRGDGVRIPLFSGTMTVNKRLVV